MTITVTIYHNEESRFDAYVDGQRLRAATSHTFFADPVRPAPTATDVADWAYHLANADLDLLQTSRDSISGETAFLGACSYRLLRLRSMSTGDVAEAAIDGRTHWLACEHIGWREITEPANRTGQALTAERVYQHITETRHRP